MSLPNSIGSAVAKSRSREEGVGIANNLKGQLKTVVDGQAMQVGIPVFPYCREMGGSTNVPLAR